MTEHGGDTLQENLYGPRDTIIHRQFSIAWLTKSSETTNQILSQVLYPQGGSISKNSACLNLFSWVTRVLSKGNQRKSLPTSQYDVKSTWVLLS